MKLKKEIYLAALLLSASSLLIFFTNHSEVSTELTVSENLSGSSFSDSTVTTSTELITDILELKTFRFASVDGQLRFDSENQLILDRELRHWLDFYLSALGELSLDQVIALMTQEIDQLPSPAKEQAHELLRSYLGYKTALSDYDKRESLAINEIENIEQLQNRFEWQNRLRRQWLSSDVADSFWQLDEIIDNYALQKLAIRNSDISANEKALALEALEQELPSDLSAFKKEMYVASNLLVKEKALSREGNAENIRQLRIEEVGIEAADRLGELDAAQNQWRNKLIAYQVIKKRILSEPGLSEEDKQDQLREYTQQAFTDKEQLRINTALQILSSEE